MRVLWVVWLAGCAGTKQDTSVDLPPSDAPEECTGGVDDDGDGAVDCDDPDCAEAPDCAPVNAPPEGLAVAIEPAAPVSEDDLRCVVATEASDPEGAPVSYSFSWSVDGAPATDGEEVDAASTAVGERWVCLATPTDGVDEGEPATAEVTIAQANRAPSSPELRIDPEAPVAGEVSYATAWSIDGVDAGLAGAEVPADLTVAGEQWTCAVVASDGALSAEPAEVSVEIAPSCGTGAVTLVDAGLEFVTLCAQTFDMGCTPAQVATGDCGDDELPVRAVTLTQDWYLGRTEITQDQFSAVLGYAPSEFSDCGGDCPVDSVTWHEAAAFANALSAAAGLDACYSCDGLAPDVTCEVAWTALECDGYRLPTEAEWEASARCGTDLVFAGSDVLDDVGWYYSNSGIEPHPVGSLAANGCGLVDMSGNAWEWTNDWFATDYYAWGESTDPLGAEAAAGRGYRGGCWGNEPARLRVSNRGGFEPDTVQRFLGFRLARTAP